MIVKLDLFFPALASSLGAEDQVDGAQLQEVDVDVDRDTSLDIIRRILDEDEELSDSTAEEDDAEEDIEDSEEPEVLQVLHTEKYGFDRRIVRFRHYVKKDLRHLAWDIAAFIDTFDVDTDLFEDGDSWIAYNIDERCDLVRDNIGAALSLFPDQLKAGISSELSDLVESTRTRLLDELEKVLDNLYWPEDKKSEHDHPQVDPQLGLEDSENPEEKLISQRQAEEASGNKTVASGTPGPPPPPPPDVELLGQEPERKRRDHRWNHITISRDRTSASEFSQELLLIFRKSRIERSRGLALTRRDTIPDFVPAPRLAEDYINLPPLFDLSQSFMTSVPSLSMHQPMSHMTGYFQRPGPSGSSSLMPSGPTLTENATVSGPTSQHNLATDFQPIKSEAFDNMDELLGRISSLETENQNLKNLQQSDLRHETIYLIQLEPGRQPSAFLDEPTWALGPRGEVLLKALFPIPDVEGWLDQRRDVAFSVGKYYIPKEQESEVQKAVREKKKIPLPKPSAETIRLESQDMKEAMEAFFTSGPELKKEHPNYVSTDPLSAPYLFWYHHRSPTAFDSLSDHHRKLLLMLTDWIDEAYGEKYARVDEQLKRGVVSYDSMVYLVRPGDVVVLNSKPGKEGGILYGKISEASPTSITPKALLLEPDESPWKKKVKTEKKKYSWKWALPVWQYNYDGLFYKNRTFVNMEMEAEHLDEEIAIQKLNIYPLRYATDATKDLLEQRGKIFWSCRERKLVAYEDAKGVYGVSVRVSIEGK